MAKPIKGGKNYKFYLEPADGYALDQLMQQLGFSKRGHFLVFLMKQFTTNKDYKRSQAKRLLNEMQALGLSTIDIEESKTG